MIVYGAATDIGKSRSENQDSYGVFPVAEEGYSGERLFLVADGMGGHRGGKRASSLAVEAAGRAYFVDEKSETYRNLGGSLLTANEIVYSTAARFPTLLGMGTTCVGMVVNGNVVRIAHIGDSRAYKIKDGAIIQLTDDHSTVAELQRRGQLSAEEAQHHPERSVLYRALGTKADAEIDVQPDITVTGVESFVLCTDGLTGMVGDDEILDIVQHNPPDHACEKLVDLANERGGYDNITVIVVQVTAE